ncbi:S-adenosyl-L-methionine-dependent methyltransferase, partial [Gilbertella persicaria]
MGNSPSKKLKQPFQKHLKDTNVLEKNSTTSTIAVLKKHNPSMSISNNNTEMNMSSFTALHRTTSLPPSPTSTLPQSIKNDYIFHGRKYQSYNTKYILPNDEIEQDRLVQVHFIYKFLFGGNFSSPVRDLLSLKQLKRNSASSSSNAQQWDLQPLPQPKVLDIACGTGTWILEMATEFPETQFYGIDIAPIYPTTIKPSNTFFSQHDILNGLPFPNEYFDYIHMRHVYTCFSEEDWTTVMNEIKRLLKPGGYIELRELYPLLYQMGPITHDFFKHFICGMKNLHNVDIAWAKKMFTVLQEIGEFADIHRQIRQLYFDLPGTIGNMARNSLRTACESYRPFFEQVNNIPN